MLFLHTGQLNQRMCQIFHEFFLSPISLEQLDLRPRWQLGEIHEESVTDARSMKKTGTHPSLTAQVRSFAEGNC